MAEPELTALVSLEPLVMAEPEVTALVALEPQVMAEPYFTALEPGVGSRSSLAEGDSRAAFDGS